MVSVQVLRKELLLTNSSEKLWSRSTIVYKEMKRSGYNYLSQNYYGGNYDTDRQHQNFVPFITKKLFQ